MANETQMPNILNNDPARGFVAATPSDSADLAGKCRGIYVGATGDVCIDDNFGNTSVVFKAVPVGTFMPVSVKRLRATLTTATNLVALY